jgi:hypothetical protein
MVYPQTGTTFGSYPGGQNNTNTGIATNIVIMVGANMVGAVQKLNIDEKRALKMIDEVGTDGHIDSVPISSTNITGACERVRFDRMRIAEAFSRGFVHVSAQRIPFDIVIIDKWNGDDGSALYTTIKSVWISGISYSFNADNWIITDNMTWEAEAIHTKLSNGNAARGGTKSMPLAIDDMEQSADRGERRGALDAPGLLKAFFTLP